jgi:uncharacterized protein YggE
MKNFFDQRLQRMLIITLGALTFFLVSESLVSFADIFIKKSSIKKNNLNAKSTIIFRGKSEVLATPDLAQFVITIRATAKNVALAQQKMTDKANELLALLDKKAVRKKDLQTTNYSTNPQYAYENKIKPAGFCKKNFCPHPSLKKVLTGYEAAQTLILKIALQSHDSSKIGEILTALAKIDVTEVNGPSFMIADRTKPELQARALAIEKAKAEARLTAKSLGVKLGKIISFYEEPQHFKTSLLMSGNNIAKNAALAPDAVLQLQSGEQKITSNVAITYEIR